MAKNSITDYSKTASLNTDIQSVDIDEGCLPSGINNAIRELMADLAAVNDGTVSLTSPAFTSVDINGGTIDGVTIGGASAAAGTFTTFTSTGIDDNALSTAVTINSSNNVGIGTAGRSASGYTILGVDNATNGGVIEVLQNGTIKGQLFYDGTQTRLRSNLSTDLVLDTNDTERLRIDSSGRVGIGTSSPDKALTISASDSQVRLYDADGTNQFASFQSDNGTTKITSRNNTSHGTIAFQRYNGTTVAESMRIDSSGRVGIGTTSPEGTLHVENVSNNSIVMDSPANRFNSIGFQTAGVDKWWLGRADSDQIAGDAFFIGIDNGNVTDAGGLSNKFVITQSGNVGIGTSSPSTNLHVSKSSVSGTSYDSNDLLTLENNGFTAINMISSASLASTLIFSDTTRAVGFLQYNHSDNSLRSNVNGSERMRIDSSGNVLVGKTVSSTNTVGVEARSNGQLVATLDGGTAFIANRKTSDGDIAKFMKDGTTVGSIGVDYSSRLYIGTGDTGLFFNDLSDAVQPISPAGDLRGNAIDLGTAGTTFKDLYLGGGVYVGGTGAANKLDDYEEGTWTPTFASGYTGTAEQTTYTKIGNVVHFAAKILIDSEPASTSAFTVTLPFTQKAGVAVTHGGVMFEQVNPAISTQTQMVGYTPMSSNNFFFYLLRDDNGAWEPMNPSDVNSNSEFYIQGTIYT